MTKKKENGTRFSRFAQVLYNNQPPDEREDKIPEFTLFLLKAGLDQAGIEYINEDRYPNLVKDRIENGRVDSKEAEKERARLRLYFSGKRNVTTDASMIVDSYQVKHFQAAMQKFKKSFPDIRAALEEVGETLNKKQTAAELARIFDEILREAADSQFLRNQNRIKARLKTVPEDTRNEVEQLKQLFEKTVNDTNVAGTVGNRNKYYKEIIAQGLSFPLPVDSKPVKSLESLQSLSNEANLYFL